MTGAKVRAKDGRKQKKLPFTRIFTSGKGEVRGGKSSGQGMPAF